MKVRCITMSIIRHHWRKICFAISLIIFLIVVKFLLDDNLSIFDTAIYNVIIFLKSPLTTNIMKVISFFASPLFCIISVPIFFLLIKNKDLGKLYTLNLIIAFLLNTGIKFIFARERPLDINLIKEMGYSFPSAHAMVSLCVYGFLSYLLVKSKLSKNIKIIGIPFMVILTILIGLSRIYLGVHFASDIIGGFACGTIYLVTYIKIMRNKIINDLQ